MELPTMFSSDGSLPTTPWLRREPGGIYVGRNKQVWMVRELALAPIQWEDPPRRLDVGRRFEGLLEAIGEKSKDIGQGMRMLSRNRVIHIQMVSYRTAQRPPEGTPEALRPLLSDLISTTGAAKSLLVAVQLQSSAMTQVAKAKGGPLSKIRAVATAATEDVEGSLDPFRDDYLVMESIYRRFGATVPRREALDQWEAWFNDGVTVDAPIAYRQSSFRVLGGREYEISAVSNFANAQMHAPFAQWLLDAATHADPAVAISIRAELEPASVTRSRLRRQRRKLIAADEEEAATGDIGREENRSTLSMAEQLETYVRQTRTAWLTECSILMAREATAADSTYADMLNEVYGIETNVLTHRQLEALSEMLPTSSTRVNPFPQDLNPAMIAYGGLAGFSNLGDETGVFFANVDPDYVPAYIDPFGASRQNLPPVMGVFGDPGSGKSLSLDTLVLTPTGWRRMGDLRVGDELIGRDGRTHHVTGVYPQGVMALYRVTLDDGSSVETTGDHLWAVSTQASSAQDVRWEIRTTDLLRESLLDPADDRQWRIPVVAPVELVTRSLSRAPYALGTQLVTDTTGAGIPCEYLLGDVAQRTALLQGLCDAAGEPTGDGTIQFKAPDRELAADVRQLVLSLGGTTRPCPQDHDAGDRVEIHLPRGSVVPFRDVRKAENWRASQAMNHATPTRTIVSVEYSRDDHAQCISVSAPDSLYVTEDFVVTHNTFACQLIAGQAAIAGVPAIFVNPKSSDSLAPWARWVESMGVPVEIVSMSKMEERGGAFDPFRFCDPLMAADVLARHIQTVIGYALTPRQNILLKDGLTRGAMAGAQCAAQALAYVDDPEVVELVTMMARSSTLFALGFGNEPQEPWLNHGGLTLIEFDRDLPLPKGGKSPESYEPAEREAVAAMRLVTRASVEILMRAGGGVLVVDEAHHFVSSEEGLATMDRLAREGRSMGLLPVFATQRVTDLLQVDMETFLSRVLVMKLNDKAEASAALRLCRLEPTQDRLDFLREAGPRRGGKGEPSRSALGIFRDMYDRHAVVQIGPIPEHIRLAMSTNRDDRQLRDEQEAETDADSLGLDEPGRYGLPGFAHQTHPEENQP